MGILRACVSWVRDWWAMTYLGTPALLRLIGMLLRRNAAQRRNGLRLRRHLSALPPDPPALLSPVGVELYEVTAAGLGLPAPPADGQPQVTVVHLLGSGETIYSPLPGLAALCRCDPAIAGFRHVIVDTPHAPGAFLGPLEFASRTFQRLRPLLGDPAPLLLMGLSRGAVAAVELCLRVSDSRGAPTAALSLSPPTRGDVPWPTSVRDLGLLEAGAEAALRLPLPRPLRRLRRFLFKHTYLLLTGAIYHELEIDDDAMFDLLARYVAENEPTRTCMRALREYALLARVSDAELRQGYADFVERATADPLVHLTMVWGTEDAWLPHGACRERIEGLLERFTTPPERLHLHTLAGWNHCVARQAEQDYGPLADMIGTACAFLSAETVPESAGASPHD